MHHLHAISLAHRRKRLEICMHGGEQIPVLARHVRRDRWLGTAWEAWKQRVGLATNVHACLSLGHRYWHCNRPPAIAEVLKDAVFVCNIEPPRVVATEH
jgi:hypothetical protein